jgi:excisionase family DNA binding protein
MASVGLHLNPCESTIMIAIEKQAAAAAASATTVTGLLPRWMKVSTAVEYSAIGRSTLYELLNAGKVKSHRIGGARLIDRESLDAFISAQPPA